MIKNLNKNQKSLLALLIFAFTFTYILRVIFDLKFNTTLSVKYTIPMIITILIILLKRKNLNLKFSIPLIIIFLVNIISYFIYDYHWSTEVFFIVNINIPIGIFLVNFKKEEVKDVIKIFLLIFNLFILINLLVGVYDYLSGMGFREYLINILPKDNPFNALLLEDMYGSIYRLYSYIGHPLTNSLYCIIFMTLNIAYINIYKEFAYFNTQVILIVSLVYSLLSNSKIGIVVVIFILFSYVYKAKNKIMYFLMILFISILVINSNYFYENIISRFTQAVQMGDITNGRLSTLTLLIANNVPKPMILLSEGKGTAVNISSYYLGLYYSFENPLIMFSYDYGIITTILIYGILFIYPIVCFIKNKKYYICTLFVIMSFVFNSYNGIAENLGLMQVYILTVYMLVCMVNEENF